MNLKSMKDQTLYAENLPNKPLGEAIFELRWALQSLEQGRQHDPGFRILYGRFYDRLSKDYPFIEDLPVSQVPEDMIPYVVRHRFRPSNNAWPVAQIGPGIMAVNDTENYTWRRFEPRVQTAIEALFEAYPSSLSELTPVGVQLTYINAILFDPLQQSMIHFLRDNLHVSIDVEPELFENQEVAQNPLKLNLNIEFPLAKPKGMGILRFSTGKKHQNPALVWQIVIHSDKDSTPKDKDGLGIWLKDAHDVAEKWFFTLIRGKLRETFEVQHGRSDS